MTYAFNNSFRREVASRCDSIPANVIETAYSPGGSAEKLYAPLSPVTAVRVPCKAGEEIVTTTPGNAASEASWSRRALNPAEPDPGVPPPPLLPGVVL